MSKFNLVVGVPSGEMIDSDFSLCLLQAVIHFFSHPFPWYDESDLTVHNAKGSILPQLRQSILEKAIEQEATHVLFIDSDQLFPRDTIARLAQHKKPVVACNIPTKGIPASPTARYKSCSNKAQGLPIFTTENSRGLERVWRVGTGVMLIDLSILKDVEKPWFPVKWIPEAERFQGEDWGFCEVLEKAGIPLYIDQELSWEVEHCGKLKYGHQHVMLPQLVKGSEALMKKEIKEKELIGQKYSILLSK